MIATVSAPEDRARLVRNLLALRTVLAMDQLQTGKCDARIDELDDELASLGHDMQSTVARASEGLRRSFLVSRMLQRATRRRQALPQE